MCCVDTYGRRKENTSVAWEPMENVKKIHALRGNLMKTHENAGVAYELIENAMQT